MATSKTELNIVENYAFFVIPSWGNLLGYPTLGKYSNHNVSKISSIGIKSLPIIPTSNSLEILRIIKEIVNQDYDIRSIGRAPEIARDYIRSMILHSHVLWEMSRYVNLYKKVEPNIGLSSKEKFELGEKIEKWINLMRNIQTS